MTAAVAAGVGDLLAPFPSLRAGHYPTPLEALPRLGAALGLTLSVKRDDLTGFAFGGNKTRQLDYYVGRARAEGADTLLVTGAVQSNFVRATAAYAARFGMGCHIQLEERVAGVGPLHRTNGNVLLDRLLGAQIHAYPEGEDEMGADLAVARLAEGLRAEGRRPFAIPLGPEHPPIGALGYVAAAEELAVQIGAGAWPQTIIVPSGSGLTHVGLLLGLRALGIETPVLGICVRRPAAPQEARIGRRIDDLARMLGIENPVAPKDIRLDDRALAPGYGQPSAHVSEAIRLAAATEGLFTDPVYTGKALAGLILAAREGSLSGNVLFWHTGGLPALFAYADCL
ncbi:MAG: D-cysteine desulfhydrase family protein [Paracoccaceae bacterium]